MKKLKFLLGTLFLAGLLAFTPVHTFATEDAPTSVTEENTNSSENTDNAGENAGGNTDSGENGGENTGDNTGADTGNGSSSSNGGSGITATPYTYNYYYYDQDGYTLLTSHSSGTASSTPREIEGYTLVSSYTNHGDPTALRTGYTYKKNPATPPVNNPKPTKPVVTLNPSTSTSSSYEDYNASPQGVQPVKNPQTEAHINAWMNKPIWDKSDVKVKPVVTAQAPAKVEATAQTTTVAPQVKDSLPLTSAKTEGAEKTLSAKTEEVKATETVKTDVATAPVQNSAVVLTTREMQSFEIPAFVWFIGGSLMTAMIAFILNKKQKA